MDKQVAAVIALLEKCSAEQRQVVFTFLRKQVKIHPIEERLEIAAEVILEAINKDASGLTFRMLRGVIAESAFNLEFLQRQEKWKDITPVGDLPYDYLLSDGQTDVRVQVKLQRSTAQKPLTSEEHNKNFPAGYFIVETQKTRTGLNAEGESTRPHRFGEFDILAVSLQPATKDWSRFMYTLNRWLVPSARNAAWIRTFQCVAKERDGDWTDSLDECVDWLKSDVQKRIAG